MPMTNETVVQSLITAAQGTAAYDAVMALINSGARIFVTSSDKSSTVVSSVGGQYLVDIYISANATGFDLLQHAVHESAHATDASNFFAAWQSAFDQNDYLLSEAVMFASEAQAIAKEVLTFGVNAPSYGYLPASIVQAAYNEVVARQGPNPSTLAFKYDLNVTLADALKNHPESAQAIGARVSTSWSQMYPAPAHFQGSTDGGGGGGSDGGGEAPPQDPGEDPWWDDGGGGGGGGWWEISDPVPYGHSAIGVSMLVDSTTSHAPANQEFFSEASVSSLIQAMTGTRIGEHMGEFSLTAEGRERLTLSTIAADVTT